MSNTKQTLNKKLNYHIKNFKEALRLNNGRILNFCEPRITYVNYTQYERKGVESDIVYLYNLDKEISIALSFSVFDRNIMKNGQYYNTLLPIEQQTVKLSYSVMKNNNKKYFYTKEMGFEEARDELKEMTKSVSQMVKFAKIDQKGIFSYIKEYHLFKEKEKKDENQIEKIKKTMQPDLKKLDELQNEITNAINEEKETYKKIEEEIESLKEQKLLIKLKKELKKIENEINKIEENIHIEKRKLNLKYEVLEKTKKSRTLKNKELNQKNEIIKKCKNLLSKHNLSQKQLNKIIDFTK